MANRKLGGAEPPQANSAKVQKRTKWASLGLRREFAAVYNFPLAAAAPRAVLGFWEGSARPGAGQPRQKLYIFFLSPVFTLGRPLITPGTSPEPLQNLPKPTRDRPQTDPGPTPDRPQTDLDLEFCDLI